MSDIEDRLTQLENSLKLAVPVGSIMAYWGTKAPTGWVVCDGSEVDKLHGALRRHLQAATGDYRTPDLRGEFLRGLDGGRGLDKGRSLSLEAQLEMVGPHTHQVGNGSAQAHNAGHDCPVRNANPDPTIRTHANDGTENRPRNIAVLYIMAT